MSPALSFQALQKIFPSLRSSDEFMTKKEYAGESIVNIHSTQEPSPAEWCEALIEALAELQKKLKKIKPYYKGTVEFHPVPISECFGEVSRRKKISDSAYRKGGEGYWYGQ